MTTIAFTRDCQIEELRAELRTGLDPHEAREIEEMLQALLSQRNIENDGDRLES